MTDRPPGWLLDAAPYAVQAEAFRRGSDRRRFGYWLEQGLGKSLVLCADFMKQLHQDRVGAMAIIAPSYLKSSWRDEWRRWRVPVPLYTWPDVPAPNDRKLREPHGVVYNYDSMIYSGGDHLEALLKSSTPYLVAADESRAIGNPNGRWNAKAMFLRTHATQLRALCGQPWTNTIMDLYPQIRWCGGLEGWNPYAFRNHFAKMGGFMGRQVTDIKPEADDELKELIASCGMRALKVDWWDDCPEKIWPAPLEFEMSKAQDKMYREMYNEYCAALPNQPEEDEELVYAAHAANAYQKLSQISRGFVIGNDGQATSIVSPKDNPALRVTCAAIEGAAGKVLVFAFHKYSIDLLSEALRGFGCVTLRGGMADEEIEDVKLRFNSDDAIKVMVAQLTVGSRGHTLLGTTSQRCSTTLYYEAIFDADLMWQSSDRNHRYGQDRAVVYHTLRCSPMDDRIAASLRDKTSMVAAVLDAVRAT